MDVQEVMDSFQKLFVTMQFTPFVCRLSHP
jgi:hypothetical protein